MTPLQRAANDNLEHALLSCVVCVAWACCVEVVCGVAVACGVMACVVMACVAVACVAMACVAVACVDVARVLLCYVTVFAYHIYMGKKWFHYQAFCPLTTSFKSSAVRIALLNLDICVQTSLED